MRNYYRIFRFNLTEKQSELLLSKNVWKFYVAIQKPRVPFLDAGEILGEVVNIEQRSSFIEVKVKFFNFSILRRAVLCDPVITLTASYFRPAGSSKEINSPPIFALDVRDGRVEQFDVSYSSGLDATVVTSICCSYKLMMAKKTRGSRGRRKYNNVSCYKK